MSRHVLITGAAGAIGTALAHTFAEAEPNATLSLVDVDADRVGATALTLRAYSARWDLADRAALEPAWHALVKSQGPVDVLVNCAGIMDMRSLSGMPWADAERLLTIDLIAPLQLMSLATPHLVQHERGGIINVSSMAGVTPLRGAVFYGAAKAGLAMASEVARLELAPSKVNVLTVYPGPVRSALERNARQQLNATFLRDFMPTGDPKELAQRIYRAFERNEARVAYPSLYDVALAAPRMASWITSRLSPKPLF